MKIYESEITDGLEEVISTNASVAYSTPVSIYIPSKKQKNVIQNLVVANEAVAENKDQFDLYYLNSVLVSTGWNKNDDVFHPQETWAAKDTPVDKQFNFMHDESDIIGHITGSLVVDQDGTEISDTSNAEKFDIITSAVIYNSWTDPELKERMTKIISEIEEGKWFVSMECLFNDFDYAVITPDDEHKVIARDDASAFLTKHLRAYGGSGKYEGYTVGRLLRNIAFSGKGLVSNPANPRSVILNDVESFAGTQAEEITNSNIYMETNHMSDVLKEQVEELKAELATAKEEAKALETEMTKQKEEEIQSKIEAFEAVVSEKDSAIAEAQAAVEAAEAGRKGTADLEKHIDSIGSFFFKDGVQMVIDGYSLEEITEILNTRIDYRELRENTQAGLFKSMGVMAPAWGMVGTLIGLVVMLSGFGGEGGGTDTLGSGMSAALITTMYGAIFANLFFLPMADKIKTRITSSSTVITGKTCKWKRQG